MDYLGLDLDMAVQITLSDNLLSRGVVVLKPGHKVSIPEKHMFLLKAHSVVPMIFLFLCM